MTALRSLKLRTEPPLEDPKLCDGPVQNVAQARRGDEYPRYHIGDSQIEGAADESDVVKRETDAHPERNRVQHQAEEHAPVPELPEDPGEDERRNNVDKVDRAQRVTERRLVCDEHPQSLPKHSRPPDQGDETDENVGYPQLHHPIAQGAEYQGKGSVHRGVNCRRRYDQAPFHYLLLQHRDL